MIKFPVKTSTCFIFMYIIPRQCLGLPVAMFSCSSFIFVELIFEKKKKPLRPWEFYHIVTCLSPLTPAILYCSVCHLVLYL